MKSRVNAGREAESIAVEHLKSHGYRILQRNVYSRGGELDIVAEHERDLVFIEVRSGRVRSSRDLAESVDQRKIRHICRSAAVWRLKNNRTGSSCRYDVITVAFTEGKPHIELFVNAFDDQGFAL